MDMKTGFTRRRHLTVWTTLALLLAPGVGTKMAEAQVAEPIFPLPNSSTAAATSPIEIKLTEQPQIKTDSIQVQLNGTPLEGTLSIDTTDLSLGFQSSPRTYNLDENILTVQFETVSGVQSEFSWPFIIGTTATSADTTEAEVATATTAPTIPLAPEFTTQSVAGSTLTLAGQTQPGATVTLNVTATRPTASLVDIGPFSVTTGATAPREMSSSAVADADGMFTVEFDATGDPVETEYQVEAIAVQGNEQETTTTTFQR
ncbi:MAG: hypothetical protein F6K11_33260 [Leptolyngbya sp. SIO3F4]|nr:hypothetical protein [Leptolyngbya sp. SIO3F4]